MRTVLLGASGNFGARILRALEGDSAIDVIPAGRRVPGAMAVNGSRAAALDIGAADFAARLAALAPHLVLHCAGPFQGQDYRVAKAALAASAHYLDLADARDFVACFAVNNNRAAQHAHRLAISGASTLPGLSSAVIDALRKPLDSVHEIEIAIAPGQRAPRGTATLKAVFSYLGSPFRWMQDGRWQRAWGWQQLQRVHFDIGTRWGAACDVPDLALLPQRYPEVHTVTFRAALEVDVQHFALWLLAGARRVGVNLSVERWASRLDRLASLLDGLGSNRGAMRVSLVGVAADGRRRRRTWQLTAPDNHGPEIPCMASILLARKLARSELNASGAYPCVGFLSLTDFESQFARWGIHTRVEEEEAV